MRFRTAVLFVGAFLVPRAAAASSVEEFPDNGSEQETRGGAWIARASDPLATFYNPAGLAGQPTRLTLQGNISRQSECFARIKARGDTTKDGTAPGGAYPRVCNDAAWFPNPQFGVTWRVGDRLGLGFVVLGPSAVGSSHWPEFVGGAAGPERYLLLASDVLLLTPSLGAGWEIAPGVRVGASVQVGIAPRIDYVAANPAINANNESPAVNDVRAELKAASWFIPGFTLGALWSATDTLDVAGWYRWSAPIDAKGDLRTAGNYFTSQVAAGNTAGVQYGDTAKPDCGNPALDQASAPPCGRGDNAHLKVPIPMEAKLGVRYHRPRRGRRRVLHRRDPLAEDLFDVEVDFTWANDRAFDRLELRFPSDADGNGALPANPAIPGGVIPPNADVPHHYRDVFGVRLGGEYDVLADRLAVRGGGFVETRATDPTYQNVDFDGAERVGLALGVTYRLGVGAHAIDLMAGYGHVFFATLDHSSPSASGLNGVAGSPCNPASNASGPTCPSGGARYRTNWPINLGTISSAIDVVNLGASYRF